MSWLGRRARKCGVKQLWMLAIFAWIVVFLFLVWTSHRQLPKLDSNHLWKENRLQSASFNRYPSYINGRPQFSAENMNTSRHPGANHHKQQPPESIVLGSQEQVIQQGCRAPPGDTDSIEGGHMGYQVFVRMRYGLLQDPRARQRPRGGSSSSSFHHKSILCVVPLLTSERTRTILETYGTECDGILLIGYTGEPMANYSWPETSNRTTAAAEQTPTIHTFQYPSPRGTSNPQDRTQARKDLLDLLSLLPYRWIHWGSDDFYFVPGFLRAYLALLEEQNKLAGVQFLDHYRLLNASDWKRYQDLYGKKDNPLPCFPAVLFHQSALTNLQEQTAQGTSESLSDWMTNRIGYSANSNKSSSSDCTSVVPSTQRDYFSAWQFLKRYFEIRAPQNVDMHRIHAVLHDQCPFPEVDALDKDGRPGYVADVTYLRAHPAPLTDLKGVCQIPPGQGDEGPDGYKGLQKISSDPFPLQKPQRVLCMVYTHEGRHERYLRAVAETWASHCDGFFAASTVTDPSIGAVHLLHEGPELYENMWMKIMAMFKYAYKHYRNDFDYFHIGGDDMYVIGENLKYTVSTGNWKGPWNQTEPLFLGGSLPLWKQRRYCGGGSGYTINRPALDLLMKLSNTPRCWPHMQSSDEDRIMSSCFRQVDFMQCTDTNDDKNETRYHAWYAQQHASWKPGQPCQDCYDLPKNHGIAWKEGLGQISERSVSFHLKNPDAKAADSGMRRYHAILYGLCEHKK